jgi:Phage tail sheath protein subtilisin-like domain/Phage tail sheath C-terminal domain
MGILNMLSPGIQVNEIDLTAIVPGTSVSVGAYVGEFNWGPCDEPMMISDENQLLSTFGTPTTETSDSFVGTSFFSCANFLSYTNALYVVRSINSSNAKNAGSSANTVLIKNAEDYENVYLYANNQSTYGNFVAKYPGKLGNSLRVSVCSDAQTFNDWEYSEYFDNAPGTSSYVLEKTGRDTKDEMHIIVVDSLGKFSGKSNTVLEKFAFVSKAKDVVGSDGQSGYYKNVLLQASSYILSLDHPDYSNTYTTWGKDSSEVENFATTNNLNISLSNGSDGDEILAANLINNWSHFMNKDQYEISLAFVGSSADLTNGITVPQYVLDNVILGASSETPTLGRRDTMLFVSPKLSDVKQARGFEVENIIGSTGFLANFNRSSSYCVADSGWKYQYDRYNNVYRWIPLNADIAGLCAYTDNVADTWYSPAGFSRGKIKNVVKLAWSPNQTERDSLYKRGVNPVIAVTGEGIVLLGDKTLQAKPSAFDRINVRRLFIILEKSISRFARYSMFEFNDAFTRAQFVAAVEPYLRTVQGRRGITDFKVICDESNNTTDIIDRNAFLGDIYIKPARSINFIQLNFVATKTGVEFNTVIGKF